MKLTFIRSNQRQILITVAKQQFKMFIFLIFSLNEHLETVLKRRASIDMLAILHNEHLEDTEQSLVSEIDYWQGIL